MVEAVRQNYRIATGGGMEPAPPTSPNPGYKKGGPVKAKGIASFKKGAQNPSPSAGHSPMVAGKSC